MNPCVSVLMSTYRESINYVYEAVDSIRNQSYKNLEINILVDDPSNTEIITLLRSIEASDPRVHIYINDKNLGLVKTLNKGIGLCTGEYIARMDADDLSHSDRIEKQLAFLENNRLDICGTGIHHLMENGSTGLEAIYPESSEDCTINLKSGSCCPHPTWLGKAAIFHQMNGYRNIFSSEDYDFLIRACLAGMKIGNVPEVLFEYRIRGSSISTSSPYKQLAVAEKLGAYYRNGKSLPSQEYKDYISSEAFTRDVNLYKNMIKQENKFNDGHKIIDGIKLLINPRYIKYKCTHKIYNRVKWKT